MHPNLADNMDDDLELNQLAEEAPQYPERSYKRRRTLNLLAIKILQSRKLTRPHNDSLPPAVSEDLYHEALNITVMEICKKIDEYDSTRGDILGWANFLLKRRFIDLVRKWRSHNCRPFNLNDIEHHLGTWDGSHSASEELKQVIEEDPDGVFTRTHIRRNPQATFQFLVLARIWEDRRWQDISTELEVPQATLCEFFQRQLNELKPYLQDYLLN